MKSRFSVAVQQEDFELGHEYAELLANDKGIGAVVAFVGTVRDLNLADDVVALELEHYPGMTEKSLGKILDEAAKRWTLQAARIVHRIGKMYPGDQIVMVLTASAHRGDAYEANHFIMDYLKTEAPFWKKEFTPDGPRWIEARDSDDKAAARWK
ncbi:molybdopterin synthase catalytic subunit MoaE [Zwartia vadi]|uniref:molybdopterin synthase catalytic subunit MoaE n=1 Tax=Zwartia vadi TaxID=3058168 RepID=UPI0025B2D599|nr:molybdopterin synthase catalytic subunit MoaE [Zwartia vadi]MDN3987033.1 molybdopterin synthase catalytic subunit MoaE [Zwartia vadi]